MNPTISTQIGQADPNAAPIKVNDLIDLLNTLLTSELQGSYIPYVIQHDTPSIDDRDKAWIELDTAGRPISMKIWYAGNSGAWRRIYNGMLGEIRGYSGDPTIDFDMDGVSPGRGKIGLTYDGWYICNGMNGTPNLSDKFILGAHMDNSAGHNGYAAGWQSTIAGPTGTADYKTGGRFIETVEEVNLPPLDIVLHGFEAKETSPDHGDANPLVDVHYSNLLPHDFNVVHYGSSPGGSPPVLQLPMWTTPPFYAAAWITFKGYT